MVVLVVLVVLVVFALLLALKFYCSAACRIVEGVVVLLADRLAIVPDVRDVN